MADMYEPLSSPSSDADDEASDQESYESSDSDHEDIDTSNDKLDGWHVHGPRINHESLRPVSKKAKKDHHGDERPKKTVHFPPVVKKSKKMQRRRDLSPEPLKPLEPDVVIDTSVDINDGMSRVMSAVSAGTQFETEPPSKSKKKKKPRRMVEVPTSNPNVSVQMKKRKPGPAKQKVVIYQEDLPQQQIEIVTKSRKRGRPKTKPDVIIEKDQGIQIGDETIMIDRPTKKKELSARQIKRMDMDAKFVEMEAIAGRKLRQNKNGKVDKRCIKERSVAQMAAARRLAEYNKELRIKKLEERNKTAVKQVISELATAQAMKKSEDKSAQADQPKPFSLFAD